MISVIVPTHNAQAYVSKCLESIISQDWEDIEIIVINDGSTDSSLDEINKIAKLDSRVRVINQVNGGRSRARNTGLDNAQGEYILFVDADDELPQGSIRLLANAMERSQTDAVVGSIEVVYEVHEELADSDAWYYTVRHEGVRIVDDTLIDDFHCSACAILFRKDIIDTNNLRFPDGLVYEDACWHWMYFTSCRNITFVSEPVYRYWRHPRSIMSSTFERKKGIAVQHLHIVDKIFSFWSDRGEFVAHTQIALKLLEDFFWFSLRYSPDVEKPLVVYECSKIIQKFNLPVEDCESLRLISEGDLSFLFPPKNGVLSESDQRNFARYLQIKATVNRVLPRGSRRRRLAYISARFAWKFLSRFARHS